MVKLKPKTILDDLVEILEQLDANVIARLGISPERSLYRIFQPGPLGCFSIYWNIWTVWMKNGLLPSKLR